MRELRLEWVDLGMAGLDVDERLIDEGREHMYDDILILRIKI